MRKFTILAAAVLLPLLSSFAAAEEANVTVSQAWARSTPGGARNGAAFLQVTAKGSPDKLVGAKSDVAEQVELHNHIHEDGVMRMRRVDAIDVPAGQSVTLEPGGYHLMLMNLKRPLKVGESLDLTLIFEKAGEVAVTANIEPLGAKGPGSAKAGHGNSHHGHGDEHHGHGGHGDGHKH